MGFKSLVYRMNIEEQKKLLAMQRTTRGQLRKGDRPWEGRLWEICQLTNRNLIRGRRDGLSGHNITKIRHSVPQVNEAVGQRRFQCLPTEISSTSGRSASCDSAPVSNNRGDWREVSRGHSSWDKTSRGVVIDSFKR